MDYNLYFHNDFDGVASAAVIVNFLESQGDSAVSFNGLNYSPNLKSEWASFDFKKPFILLDFLFHPDADWWFDHHSTSFIDQKWQAEFKGDLKHVFGPTIKSACKLVADHLKSNFNYKPPEHIEDLIFWATKIDSADYESAVEAIDGKDPAIKLTKVMDAIDSNDDNSGENLKTIVRGLNDGPISEVMKIQMVTGKIEKIEKEEAEVKRIFKDISSVEGRAVFIDGSNIKIQLSNYFSYYFYPEIDFSATLKFYGGYFHLSIGKNLWNKTEIKVNIGEFMKKYGGGGHDTIGGVERETKSEILKIAKEVIQYLNDNG